MEEWVTKEQKKKGRMCWLREKRIWQSDRKKEEKKESRGKEKVRSGRKKEERIWQCDRKKWRKKKGSKSEGGIERMWGELCACVRAIACHRGSVMSPATQLNSRAGWWRWDGGPGIQPVSSQAFNSAAQQPAVTHTQCFLSLTHSCTHWETLRLFVSYIGTHVHIHMGLNICTHTFRGK